MAVFSGIFRPGWWASKRRKERAAALRERAAGVVAADRAEALAEEEIAEKMTPVAPLPPPSRASRVPLVGASPCRRMTEGVGSYMPIVTAFGGGGDSASSSPSCSSSSDSSSSSCGDGGGGGGGE